MNLSKKDRLALTQVFDQLDRAKRYIASDKVTGIAVATKWPNGASYTTSKESADMLHDGVCAVDVMDKHIGSDITGLYDAHKLLKNILFPDTL